MSEIPSKKGAKSRGCVLSDVELTLPLHELAVPLINGFGFKGAKLPTDGVSWRWDDVFDPSPTHTQRGLNCRVWLGGADAGVQLNLQGSEQAADAAASHCGMDDAGQLRCDELIDAQYNIALGSTAWYNANKVTPPPQPSLHPPPLPNPRPDSPSNPPP